MKIDIKEAFLKSIKDDTPRIKLFKYRALIDHNQAKALQLSEQMLKISLQNKLTYEYRFICQYFKLQKFDLAEYREVNQRTTEQINHVIGEKNKYKLQKNYQSCANSLLRLGRLYFQIGDYKESSSCFDQISEFSEGTHGIKYEQYGNQLALSLYLLNEPYHLLRYNSKAIEKSTLEKLKDLCIIKDLNNIQFKKNLDKPFQNLVRMNLSNLEISKNQVMSYNDIGFLYSLLTIVYKKKTQIKNVAWSFKLQNLFLKNKYKELFEIIEKQRHLKSFTPIIRQYFDHCCIEIKKRVLEDVISSYDRCPFKTIQELTGFTEGELRVFFKNIPNSPYTFDPISSAVVYKQKIPLYRQVSMLHQFLQNKFAQQLLTLTHRQADDDIGMMGLMKRSSGRSGRSGRSGLQRQFHDRHRERDQDSD